MATAASILGVLVEHLGPGRQMCVADAVPALVKLLQTADGAEEACCALHKMITSRPADGTEGQRIIDEGGIDALRACSEPTVSLVNQPRSLPLTVAIARKSARKLAAPASMP